VLGYNRTDGNQRTAGSGLAPTFFFERERRAVEAEELVRPVVEAAGLELVDVTFRRESGRRVLRVTIDGPDGVDLDTISQTSERISRRLDLEGFEPHPYALEVTSPGLERPLVRPEDFGRRIGQRIKIKTAAVVQGGKVHEGELVSADGEAIVIAAAGGELRVPYDDILSARPVVDWKAELKGSTK
jgi:ribosome maturation factor RimP